MIQVYLFFALLIAALATTFALQNTAIVTVSFLLWGFTGSLALVLFVALTTGAITGWLVTMPSVLRARISDVGQRRKMNALEASLAEHKQRLDETQKQLTEPAAADAPEAAAPQAPE